jgi:hypothetical protein
LLLLLAACGEKAAPPPLAPEAPSPPDRDAWWNAATGAAAGGETVLCPRELRALLEEGRKFGFAADEEWWGRRGAWAAERILELDPDDVEANALSGRRSLQSIDGFERTWARMIATRAPSPEMTEMLERYGPWVEEARPVFLTREEFEVERARLGQAAAHLDRLDADPGFAAEQRMLVQVRSSPLGRYPFVHARAGPFLVFYAARDLRRDPEAEAAEEETRLLGARELRQKQLAGWTPVLEELVADMRALYPEATAAHSIPEGRLIPQWIFGDPEWYADYAPRIRRDDEEPPYRLGFHHPATGWAYLAEPTEAASDGLFRESLAYLGAVQILRIWASDPKDPTANRWDESEDLWFKEGLPAFLASRRVKEPVEGPALKAQWELPPLTVVVHRRGRHDRGHYLALAEDATEAPEAYPPDGGFTDLAWLLVRHLNADERRGAFERYLRGQVEGTGKGFSFFEECFGIRGTEGWKALQRSTYSSIE